MFCDVKAIFLNIINLFLYLHHKNECNLPISFVVPVSCKFLPINLSVPIFKHVANMRTFVIFCIQIVCTECIFHIFIHPFMIQILHKFGFGWCKIKTSALHHFNALKYFVIFISIYFNSDSSLFFFFFRFFFFSFFNFFL